MLLYSIKYQNIHNALHVSFMSWQYLTDLHYYFTHKVKSLVSICFYNVAMMNVTF